MSKWWLLFPLLEEILIRLSIVTETAAFSKDTLRVLVRAALGLVLLVHVFTVTASHLAVLLPDCRHCPVGILGPTGSPPSRSLTRRPLGPA